MYRHLLVGPLVPTATHANEQRRGGSEPRQEPHSAPEAGGKSEHHFDNSRGQKRKPCVTPRPVSHKCSVRHRATLSPRRCTQNAGWVPCIGTYPSPAGQSLDARPDRFASEATFRARVSLTRDVEVPAAEEFTRFVAADGAALLRFARLLILDPGDAEDALQTALLRALRRWGPRMTNPRAYVRACLVNLARDRHRRRHLTSPPVVVNEDALPSAGDHADALAAQSELDALLRLLPRRQRAVVILRVIEGLSEAETASVMGCSTGTVKSSLSRGLARLRDELADGVDEVVSR